MKKTVLLAYLALLITFLLPLPEADGPPETPEPLPSESPLPAPEPAAETVRVLMGETVEEMALEEYLRGVVAAEMPASYPPQALRAQAVAARTYTLYCASTGKHSGAEVCTDPGCCQAWSGEESLRERWGGEYEHWSSVIREAVEDTAGQRLCYEGRPVFAAFHASSAGCTEDSGAVWRSLPYLPSVSSPETAETVPTLISTLECGALDFRDVILSACPEADLTGAPETWADEPELDAAGRVERIRVGGAELSGARMRSLFSLRSTAFTLEYTQGRFLFTVSGSGHGVGMSQVGAKLLAEQGADYREILAHYYPGTVLEGDEGRG